MSFDKAKELLCGMLLKGGLKSVSADIQKLYINQCRKQDFDKVMGSPCEGVKEDSSVVVDDLLFGYTKLERLKVERMADGRLVMVMRLPAARWAEMRWATVRCAAVKYRR
jgi:hypothetical protein